MSASFESRDMMVRAQLAQAGAKVGELLSRKLQIPDY